MMIGTLLRARSCAADLEAVDLRQHHVQHDEVEGLVEAGRAPPGRRARARPRSPPSEADRPAASGPTARRRRAGCGVQMAVTFGDCRLAGADDRATPIPGSVLPGRSWRSVLADVLARVAPAPARRRAWPPTCSSTAPGAPRRPRRIARRSPDRARRLAAATAATADAGGRDASASRGFRSHADALHAAGRAARERGRRAAPGASRRQVVVVAARDAPVVPDAPGSAADTAALLELARVFEGRATRKTLVLASVDGSTLGRPARAARRTSCGDPRLVDAVLVMSDLGRPEPRGPLLLPWSNDASRASIGLQRTAADSLRQELELDRRAATARSASSRGWRSRSGWARRACCSSSGFDAVRISGSGELPPDGRRRRSRRSTPTGSARSGARRCARSRRSTRPAAAGARPAVLRARREPGAARLGARRCWRAASSCRRWWRPSTPLPAPAAGASPSLPWLRWLVGWTAPFAGRARCWRSCSRWRAPRPRRRRPRCRPTCCRSTARRSACSAAWPWRWCWRLLLAALARRRALIRR